MLIRKNYIFLFLLLFPFIGICQKGTIIGYVGDDQSRSPLSGVSIQINGGIISAENSDHFGTFKLRDIVPGHYEVILSHIGYETEKVSVDVETGKVSVIKAALQKSNVTLSDVTVVSRKPSVLNTIAAVDLKLRPINTSQDILRMVSGLFIAQHAGGGKAEQIFLRGYDIDHGTDINISVDGIPVNMVSHAHGQGYADLHFLIPEAVEKVNFDKGPYFVNKGNLATAGFVELQTKDFLQENMVKIQAGEYNTQRVMGMLKLLNKENDKVRQQMYVASEYFKSDGYFDSPQHFHRFNILGKYNAIFNNNAQLTILASTLDSKWNASGQIPERAVESGMIGKFGSIDNSEGGNTNRTNISAKFTKQWQDGWQTTDQLYFTNYHFNLFSNFTFFLKDSINGDEINQRESRNIYGYTGTMSKNYMLFHKNASTEFGWGGRYDDINNIELNHVVKRKFLNHEQLGDIHEWNGFVYAQQHVELSNRFNINGGLRYDYFRFGYKNILAGENNFKKQSRGIVSPKINFNYNLNNTVRFYLNTGLGFHSNDTRVILNNTAKDILPSVFGTDLGVVLKPNKQLLLKAALWQLYSQQEFVYVGDEGIVEPGGRTERKGVDISARYQVNKWLYADVDVNYARPRAIDEAKGQDYVPLAPTFTSIGGLTMKAKAFNTSIRYRYIGDRPANEDNTARAQGYFLLDAVVSYTFKKLEFSVSAENLFNRYWKEAQFDTESRLQYETAPVSEIHYTPGTPLFIKAGLSYSF
ncbi:MAG: TonB-dependent receptor [Agriterribacter sp.]